MLIGHKAKLGSKRIRKVTVFTNDPLSNRDMPGYLELRLFFHVVDVPGDVDHVTNLHGQESLSLESSVLHMRDEGKRILHEHIFRYVGRGRGEGVVQAEYLEDDSLSTLSGGFLNNSHAMNTEALFLNLYKNMRNTHKCF
jgi:hypothetical protein